MSERAGGGAGAGGGGHGHQLGPALLADFVPATGRQRTWRACFGKGVDESLQIPKSPLWWCGVLPRYRTRFTCWFAGADNKNNKDLGT